MIFIAGERGPWRIERITPVIGESLAQATALSRTEGEAFVEPPNVIWTLTGVRSHHRYMNRAEQAKLEAVQEGLGRPSSTRAALIPIRKSAAWWALPQDERRAIFEEQSRHIADGLRYLPAIARRLYHSREIGGPFDFLTWFEYAEADAAAFEELVDLLRRTEEWRFVEREVDVRLKIG